METTQNNNESVKTTNVNVEVKNQTVADAPQTAKAETPKAEQKDAPQAAKVDAPKAKIEKPKVQKPKAEQKDAPQAAKVAAEKPKAAKAAPKTPKAAEKKEVAAKTPKTAKVAKVAPTPKKEVAAKKEVATKTPKAAAKKEVATKIPKVAPKTPKAAKVAKVAAKPRGRQAEDVFQEEIDYILARIRRAQAEGRMSKKEQAEFDAAKAQGKRIVPRYSTYYSAALLTSTIDALTAMGIEYERDCGGKGHRYRFFTPKKGTKAYKALFG